MWWVLEAFALVLHVGVCWGVLGCDAVWCSVWQCVVFLRDECPNIPPSYSWTQTNLTHTLYGYAAGVLQWETRMIPSMWESEFWVLGRFWGVMLCGSVSRNRRGEYWKIMYGYAAGVLQSLLQSLNAQETHRQAMDRTHGQWIDPLEVIDPLVIDPLHVIDALDPMPICMTHECWNKNDPSYPFSQRARDPWTRRRSGETRMISSLEKYEWWVLGGLELWVLGGFAPWILPTRIRRIYVHRDFV